jgi:hypothetical protein
VFYPYPRNKETEFLMGYLETPPTKESKIPKFLQQELIYTVYENDIYGHIFQLITRHSKTVCN